MRLGCWPDGGRGAQYGGKKGATVDQRCNIGID